MSEKLNADASQYREEAVYFPNNTRYPIGIRYLPRYIETIV